MDTIEFIFMLAAFGIVLFWYVENAQNDAGGSRGLLAIKALPAAFSGIKKSYRAKPRISPTRFDRDTARSTLEATAAFRQKSAETNMTKRFRRQDEARYRAKDKSGAYKPRNGPTAA